MSQPDDPQGFGDKLRTWRGRRRLSQLELAGEAGISARHLSFVETGRSRPSREMVVHLARSLDVPLREQNDLLLAAGYAPTFPQRPLADPALHAVSEAVEMILTGHEPYPALALDRYWNLVSMNRAVPLLLEGVASHLLKPPVNVLRLSLHPQGLAPRIQNLGRWREHLLERLARQLRQTADPLLAELKGELASYPAPDSVRRDEPDHDGIAVPLQLSGRGKVMSFISTTTVFGTATDVTVSELTLETFFPANPQTASVLRAEHERMQQNSEPFVASVGAKGGL